MPVDGSARFDREAVSTDASGRRTAPPALLADVVGGLAFLARLPAFLRRPMNPAEARTLVDRRRAQRDAAFLALMHREVFGVSSSPYRALLHHAGCERGDLDQLVRTEGLDRALAVLARRGVYLTVDEFKGRQAIRRGGVALQGTPGHAATSTARHSIVQRTSGTRGVRSIVPLELAFEAEHAASACLFLAARGHRDWMHALWEVPGGAALRHALWLSKLGAPPTEWFTQVDPGRALLPARYAWSWRLARLTGTACGVRLPGPRFVAIDEPAAVVDWIRRCLAIGRVPHLWTFVTSAVRVCQAAEAAGVRLDGVQFTANGEPITRERVAAIERTGARLGGYYGSVETGPMGYACLAPSEPDEMHVLDDLHAVLTADETLMPLGLPQGAVLVTSLRPSTPLLLLNVAIGDRAVAVTRRCGCPMESYGWNSRMHEVRSYSKVTAAGMTFFDSDLIRILEQSLPSKFGGGPTDYQLAEEATPDGGSALRLRVASSLGPLDEGALIEVFLAAVSASGAAARVMSAAWREAGVVRIERRAPIVSDSGKIAHFRAPSARLEHS